MPPSSSSSSGEKPLEPGIIDGQDVVDVDEGRLAQADVHEGGLHAGQHPLDPPLVDVSRDVRIVPAFDVEFGDGPIFQEGHPGFVIRGVNDQLLIHDAPLSLLSLF